MKNSQIITVVIILTVYILAIPQLIFAQEPDQVNVRALKGEDDISTQKVNDVFILVDPPVNTVGVNQVFTVTVKVQADLQPLNGVTARLEFDPGVLQVETVTDFGVPPFEHQLPSPSFDNTVGFVLYGVANGIFSGDITPGNFNLMQIRFKAIAETPISPTILDFEPTVTEATSIAEPGFTVLTSVTSGTVDVQTATAITLVDFTAVQRSSGVTVIWQTGTEIDNAGFNLYRAITATGPYGKINPALIPAKGDAVSGAGYIYLDSAATDTNATYYYKLEDINTNAVSTFHGPVSTAPDVTVDPPAWYIYLPVIFKE